MSGTEKNTGLTDHHALGALLRVPLEPFRTVARARILPFALKKKVYRGTSLTRKRTPLGPHRRPMPKVPGESQRSGPFFMGEVPL